MPSPVSSTLILTASWSEATSTATAPSLGVWRSALVNRFSATRSVIRGAAHRGDTRVDPRLHPHALCARAGLDTADAAPHQRVELDLAHLQPESARIDAGQLEEVVHQPAEVPHLVVHGGRIGDGGPQPVLDGLQHRLQRRERGPKVMAGVCHDLPTGVEEALQLARHVVEGRAQLGDLRGSVHGARACRSPRARASLASRTLRTGTSTDRATSTAPTIAPSVDALASASTVRSCSESNISTPESSTAARGTTAAPSASAIRRSRRDSSRRASTARARPRPG